VKKVTLLVVTLLLLPLLVACQGTLEVGIERTPTPDLAATATLAALATENARLAAQVATLAPTAAPTIVPPVTSSPPPPQPGLLALKEGAVILLSGSNEQRLAPLPEDAGHLALGSRYLAYVQGSRIQALSLAGGTTRPLLDLGDRPGQDFDLRWSTDGSALVYAVAWDEPDGARKVELGMTDGYQQTVLDILVARPAGPTPTPLPFPPVPAEPGFAILNILGFDRSTGRLAVTQAGGQERYSAVWFYDTRAEKRVQTMALPAGVQQLALSPDGARLAVAVAGALQVYRMDDLGASPPLQVKLSPETHAGWLCWAPDSQRLAYMLYEGAVPDLVASPSLSLWVWEAKTSQARQIAPAAGPEGTLHGWTADSKAVIVELLDGISRQRSVSLVDVATGRSTSLPVPQGSSVLGWVGNH